MEAEEVKVAIVSDEGFNWALVVRKGARGLVIAPDLLGGAREPLVRVAAAKVADRRRSEPRVTLEELRRRELRGLIAPGRSLTKRASECREQLIGEVASLAADDADAASNERTATTSLVRDQSRRLRASYHRHL